MRHAHGTSHRYIMSPQNRVANQKATPDGMTGSNLVEQKITGAHNLIPDGGRLHKNP